MRRQFGRREMSDLTNVPPEIVVPGSISNLGPGFDVLSVAVRLYLRAQIVEIRPSEPDTVTGAELIADTLENLLVGQRARGGSRRCR